MDQRLVIFSDVQGNSVALEAILSYIAKLPNAQTVDLICLGDVATGYAPNIVIDLLREHHVMIVRGNMDDAVLNLPPIPADEGDDTQRWNDIDTWCSESLSTINRQYLQNSNLSAITTLGHCRYGCYHGSPKGNLTALKPEQTHDALRDHLDTSVDVQFTGNTHDPFLLPIDNQLLVNPGSVGFPNPLRNGKRPLLARFITVEDSHIAFHSVTYSVDDFKSAVLNSEIPHPSWYLSHWDI